jgi:putative spermidine/putrescine transport system ATP-binding protein
MSRGEIQQISPPLELYCRPANSFVASFIGEINRLPMARFCRNSASVSFSFPGSLTLTSDRHANLKLPDDENVRIFVRPENIAVADPSKPGANVVAAKVLSHIYQGSHTITRLEAGQLGQIEMRVGGGQIIEERPIGTMVNIALSLNEAVILRDNMS